MFVQRIFRHLGVVLTRHEKEFNFFFLIEPLKINWSYYFVDLSLKFESILFDIK